MPHVQGILLSRRRWHITGIQCCLYSLVVLGCFFKSPEALSQQAVTPKAATQVIATAGESVEVSGSMILSWTIGEPLVELHSANMLLVQGFHQPVFKIAQLATAPGFKDIISVYPNPAIEFITISLAKRKQSAAAMQRVKAELRDLLGRLVYEDEFEGSEHTIDVSNVTNGAYILRLTQQEDNSLIGSFTIEKLH